MPEENRPTRQLPQPNRERVSTRSAVGTDTSRSMLRRFGSLASSFTKKIVGDAGDTYRERRQETLKARQMETTSKNVDSLNQSADLQNQQNDLLARIIDALKGLDLQQSPDGLGRSKPGRLRFRGARASGRRGRFGNRARARLQRIQQNRIRNAPTPQRRGTNLRPVPQAESVRRPAPIDTRRPQIPRVVVPPQTPRRIPPAIDTSGIRQQAQLEADRVRHQATEDADRVRQQAQADVERTRVQAEQSAERIRQQAEADADRVKAQAADDVERIRQQATEDADRIKAQAEADQERIRQQAQADADRLKGQSSEEADRIRQRATADSDSIRRQAEADADRIRQQASVDSESTRARADSEVERIRQQANAEAEEIRTRARADAEALRRSQQDTRPAAPAAEAAPRPTAEPVSRPSATPDFRVTAGGGRAAGIGVVVGAGAGTATGQSAGQAAAAGAQAAVATVVISQAAEQTIRETVKRSLGRQISTKLPFAGLLAAIWFGSERVARGDWIGAGLELTSGVAGTLGAVTFGLGTAASVAIDVGLLTRDVYEAVYGVKIEDENPELLNSRMSALSSAITRALNDVIREAPRLERPELNEQTRQRLLELYREAQENEALYNAIGADVMAGLGPLLMTNISGNTLAQRRAREGMERLLSRLEPLMMSTRGASSRVIDIPEKAPEPTEPNTVPETRDLVTPSSYSMVSSDGTTAGSPSLLQLLSDTEFNSIEIEAQKIEFDGKIEVLGQPETSRYTTRVAAPTVDSTPVRSEITPTAAPASQAAVSTARQTPGVMSRLSMAIFGGRTSAQGPSVSTSPPAAQQASITPAFPSLGGPTVSGSMDGAISEVIESGPGFNVVKYDDGKIERRTGSRNWRNNNPGNIEFGDFARRQGAIGSDGRFAIFPTYEMGKRAKEALLFEGRGYSELTVAQAIARYAPPTENDTAMYIRVASSAAGVSPNTRMKDLDSGQRQALLAAMERVEGFRVGNVQVIQESTVTAVAEQAPTSPGIALATEGVQMAAADQAQMRGQGQEIVVQVPPASAPQRIVGAAPQITGINRGEVSLNRRLEKQVA